MNTLWMTRWSYSREKWRWIVTREDRPVVLVCLVCLDEHDEPDKRHTKRTGRWRKTQLIGSSSST